MPFPIDVSRCLAFASTNVPLRICTIPFESLRARLAARGLRSGDEIVLDVATDGDVVLAKRDGRRVLVERQDAVMVEVEPRTPAQALPARPSAVRLTFVTISV